MTPVRKAVIPAAGLGTRFLPATKAIPKEMIPIVDKPAIQYAVEEAVAAGITDVLIVTSSGKDSMEDHFDRAAELELALDAKGKTAELEAIQRIGSGAHIHYCRQHRALGLGHAVGMAADHVGDESFAVLLPDEIMVDGGHVLRRMIDTHGRTGGAVVSLQDVTPEEAASLGVVDPDGVEADGVVRTKGVVEKPPVDQQPSTLALTGRYVLPGAAFDEIERVEPGAGGEIQLTDALAALVGTCGLYGVVIEAGRYDAGKKLEFLRATVEIALDRPDLGPAFREVLEGIVDERGLGR